jgi:hypothetical protein
MHSASPRAITQPLPRGVATIEATKALASVKFYIVHTQFIIWLESQEADAAFRIMYVVL